MSAESERPAATRQLSTGSRRALLFSDIEGSTRLLQRHGAAYADLVFEHRRLLEAAFSSNGGTVHGTEGDSFFVSFADATSGARAALDAQLALASHPWPDRSTVRVRIGLHVGDVQEVAESIFGMAVHHAARVMSAAHGGQIVASRELVDESRPSGCEWRALGGHHLKDITGPVELFQLTHRGLEADFPPLRAHGSGRSNLPPPRTALVGRTDEVEALRLQLAPQQLVTVVGVGGAGKTRVALTAAARVLSEFVDGVWFTDFASQPPGSVELAPTVAASIGASAATIEELIDIIGRQKQLFVFDTCEHVLEGVGDLAEDLLRRCPGVGVLATSREALGVDGEWVWRLGPLPTADAAELFLERAARVGAPPVGRDVVERICASLDGIPLAVELAATQLAVTSLGSLEEALRASPIDLGARRGGPSRQRTVRSVIEWSDALLTDDARATLRIASVNGPRTGWGDEALVEMADAAGLTLDALRGALGELVGKSLVVPAEGAADRWRMLGPIRNFAFDALASSSALLRAAQDAHAGWTERLAVELGGAVWRGEADERHRSRLVADHENLLLAVDRALDADRIDDAATLCGWLGYHWAGSPSPVETLSRLDRTLARSAGSGHPMRVPALMVATLIRQNLGEAFDTWMSATLAEAASLPADDPFGWIQDALTNYQDVFRRETSDVLSSARDRIEAAHSHGSRLGLTITLHAVSIAASEENDIGVASATLDEAIALSRHMGDAVGLTRLLHSRGELHRKQAAHEDARIAFEDALVIAKRSGDTTMELWLLHELVAVSHALGEDEAAASLAVAAVDVARGRFPTEIVAWSEQEAAWHLLLAGDADHATSLARSAMQRCEGTEPHPASVRSIAVLRTLGEVERVYGDRGAAQHILAKAAVEADRARRTGDGRALSAPISSDVRDLLATALSGLASVRSEQDPDTAARLLGCAESQYSADAPARRRHHDAIVTAVSQSAGHRFATLRSDGVRTPPADLLATTVRGSTERTD